jgi:PilZ domain
MAMSGPHTFVEQRKHPRAQLKLPARIRWHGPIGMRLETTQTVDVSRDGMLFHRSEPCDRLARMWVAFPFDPAGGATTQPETPARVVRVEPDPEASGYWVAVKFENTARAPKLELGRERRGSERIPFALPIFVRLAGTPWPEEFMTQDISQHGARFETSHIYAPGDRVLAKIPWGEWSTGEVAGRVVRVEAMEDSPGPAPVANPEEGKSAMLTSVAVEWVRTRKA